MKRKSTRKKSSLLKMLSIKKALMLVLLIAAGIVVLELTNTTYFFHRHKAISGIIPSRKLTSLGQRNQNKDTNVPNSSTSSSTDSTNLTSKDTNSSSTSQNFLVPYGTFVSNHHPNLSGSPAPSKEQSVCQTTPGASCFIQFTRNGVVKKLPSQVVNKDGAAIWDWDVNEAGFTDGSWQILAISSLSGKSKTTADPLPLEVGL
jgi:hypothetical protein